MKQKTDKTQEEINDKKNTNLFDSEMIENAEQVVPISEVKTEESAAENYPRVAISNRPRKKLAPLSIIAIAVLSLSVFALIGSTIYKTSADNSGTGKSAVLDVPDIPVAKGNLSAINADNTEPVKSPAVSTSKKTERTKKTYTPRTKPVVYKPVVKRETFNRQRIVDEKLLKHLRKISKKRFERFKKERKKSRKNRDDDDD